MNQRMQDVLFGCFGDRSTLMKQRVKLVMRSSVRSLLSSSEIRWRVDITLVCEAEIKIKAEMEDGFVRATGSEP